MNQEGYFEAFVTQQRRARLAELRRLAAEATLALYGDGKVVHAAQGFTSFAEHAAPLREDAGPATIIAMTRSQ